MASANPPRDAAEAGSSGSHGEEEREASQSGQRSEDVAAEGKWIANLGSFLATSGRTATLAICLESAAHLGAGACLLGPVPRPQLAPHVGNSMPARPTDECWTARAAAGRTLACLEHQPRP